MAGKPQPRLHWLPIWFVASKPEPTGRSFSSFPNVVGGSLSCSAVDAHTLKHSPYWLRWDPLQLTSTGDSLFPRSGLDTSTLPSLIRVFHLFSLPRAQSALSLILPLDTRTIELYLFVRATSAGHFSFVPRSTLICKFWDSWTSWY